MPVEVTCVDCGTPFTPSRADVLRGAWWYTLCPDCRVSSAEPASNPREPAAPDPASAA
jgi:hypothetical protein